MFEIQDGGRPPFWKKPLNRHISATVWPIVMKFGTVTQIRHLQGTARPLKFRIFEIQDGGGRNLENHKNRDITATDWPIFAKFGKIMQNGSLSRLDRLKIWISKIQDGGGRHFENHESPTWPQWIEWFSWNFLRLPRDPADPIAHWKFVLSKM